MTPHFPFTLFAVTIAGTSVGEGEHYDHAQDHPTSRRRSRKSLAGAQAVQEQARVKPAQPDEKVLSPVGRQLQRQIREREVHIRARLADAESLRLLEACTTPTAATKGLRKAMLGVLSARKPISTTLPVTRPMKGSRTSRNDPSWSRLQSPHDVSPYAATLESTPSPQSRDSIARSSGLPTLASLVEQAVANQQACLNMIGNAVTVLERELRLAQEEHPALQRSQRKDAVGYKAADRMLLGNVGIEMLPLKMIQALEEALRTGGTHGLQGNDFLTPAVEQEPNEAVKKGDHHIVQHAANSREIDVHCEGLQEWALV